MDSDNGKHKSLKMDNGNGPVKVCLIDAPFDTNNRGVSALASSLVKLVTETLPDARRSFFMGNPGKTNDILYLAEDTGDRCFHAIIK